MFIIKCKSKKLWKYVNRSAIIPDLNSWYFLSTTITTITKINSASLKIDIIKIKVWLDKKKAYKMGFEHAKKKYFISINKFYLAIILELSTLKKVFKALNKKYFTINTTCLHQFHTKKIVVVIKKYEEILILSRNI